MPSSMLELKAFGYRFIGPVVVAFFDAFSKEAKGHGINKLYFLAREGYFLKELYSHYQSYGLGISDVNSEYLLCSRAFLFKLMLVDQNQLRDTLIHHYRGSFKDLLVRRYGFNGGDIDIIVFNRVISHADLGMQVKLPSDSDLVEEMLSKVAVAIESQLDDKVSIYNNYLNTIGFYESGVTKHVVDIGFSGTIQKALSSLTGQQTVGHYMVTTPRAVDGVSCKFNGYFGRDKSFQSDFKLLSRSLFLEAMLTAPHGQIVDIFNVDGETRFGFSAKTRAQHEFGQLRAVMEGAKSYMDDVLPESLQLGADEIPAYYDSLVSGMLGFPRDLRAVFDVDDHISGFGIINPTQLFG